MNVMWCASMSAKARSGSQRRMSTALIPLAPGRVTAFIRPEMWARGAGIRMASSGTRPCTARHELRLVGQSGLGVQHPLGAPCGTGGVQHHRQVSGALVVYSGDRLALSRPGVRPGRGPPPGPGRVGPGCGRARPARLVVHGRGHRPQPPARPVQGHGLPAVGRLPGHRVAAPRRPGPAARRPAARPRRRVPRRRSGFRRRARPGSTSTTWSVRRPAAPACGGRAHAGPGRCGTRWGPGAGSRRRWSVGVSRTGQGWRQPFLARTIMVNRSVTTGSPSVSRQSISRT